MVGAGGQEEMLPAASAPVGTVSSVMPESVAAEEEVLLVASPVVVLVWWLNESGLPAEMVWESETGLSDREWAAELEESAEGENLRFRGSLVCCCWPFSVRITLAVLA